MKQVEILAVMIREKQFTIRKISEKTNVSTTTVWRFAEKLVQREIIQKTGRETTRPGRGKPAQNYRYKTL